MSTMAASVTSARTIFDPEHEDYRESYARFLQREVVPHYEEWRQDQLVPRQLFAHCARYGFLAPEVPEEYGGSGISDWRFNVILTEEAMRAGVADAMTSTMIHSDVVLPYLLSAANPAQRERWLPAVAAGEKILAIAMTEPGTGSDLSAMKSHAKRHDEGWVLNGTKTFITNGINADLVVVAARTSEDRHRGLSLFVLERGMPGFERGKQIAKLGQHASDTAELFFNDVRIPPENLLGEEGGGFLQLVSRLVPERLMIAVSSTAGCEVAFDLTLGYIKQRRAFGQPVGSFQNSRFVMAELKTKIELTRCFVDRCIERHVAGICTAEEAAMAKWWATDLYSAVTDAGLQLHGGYGYTAEYPIGQAWIDARSTRIYGGANEIMKEVIGRRLGL